jgi:imidazolonepropionase-like amidohydrolase
MSSAGFLLRNIKKAYLGMEGNTSVLEDCSDLKCLYAATGLAATELGLAETTGTLQTGMLADMLLLSKDVIQNVELFDKEALVEVFKEGKTYKGLFPLLGKASLDSLYST